MLLLKEIFWKVLKLRVGEEAEKWNAIEAFITFKGA
jgi:hypothetical protein